MIIKGKKNPFWQSQKTIWDGGDQADHLQGKYPNCYMPLSDT